MSPPMIEPARTRRRARGRSATARTAAAMFVLADERDRVDGDPLAAQVVAVGLAHGAERDLGDLGAAADDDDPLAEDPVEGSASGVAARTPGSLRTRPGRGRPRRGPRPRSRSRRRPAVRRRPSIAPDGAQVRTRAAALGDPGDDRRDRLRPVVEDEPDRDGRRDVGAASTGHRRAVRPAAVRRRPGPDAPRPTSATVSRSGSTPAVGSCSSYGERRARRTPRAVAPGRSS